MRKFLNVLGILFAVLLSVVLVILCTVVPVFGAARTLIEPAQLTQVITDSMAMLAGGESGSTLAFVRPRSSMLADGAPAAPAEGGAFDTREILRGLLGSEEVLAVVNDLLPEEMKSEGGEASEEVLDFVQSAMGELSKSPAVNKILTTYTEDVIAAALDPNAERHFNADFLRRTLEENEDELVDLFVGLAPEGTTVDKEQIRSSVRTFADEGVNDLVEALPPADELLSEVGGADMEQIADLVNFLRSPSLFIALIAVVLFIACLIYVCRFPRFKGFLWVGIDAGIAALLLAPVCLLVRPLLPSILEGAIAVPVMALADAFIAKLWIGVAIVAAAAVLLIALFIVLRKTVVNKKKAVEEQPAA